MIYNSTIIIKTTLRVPICIIWDSLLDYRLSKSIHACLSLELCIRDYIRDVYRCNTVLLFTTLCWAKRNPKGRRHKIEQDGLLDATVDSTSEIVSSCNSFSAHRLRQAHFVSCYLSTHVGDEPSLRWRYRDATDSDALAWYTKNYYCKSLKFSKLTWERAQARCFAPKKVRALLEDVILMIT